jgi:hypothetical protein
MKSDCTLGTYSSSMSSMLPPHQWIVGNDCILPQKGERNFIHIYFSKNITLRYRNAAKYNFKSTNWKPSVLQCSTLTCNLPQYKFLSHLCCAAVVHNACYTLQFARHQCCIAKSYRNTNCKAPLLHITNFLQKWNKIPIPAVSLLQSGLTAIDVSNVGM